MQRDGFPKLNFLVLGSTWKLRLQMLHANRLAQTLHERLCHSATLSKKTPNPNVYGFGEVDIPNPQPKTPQGFINLNPKPSDHHQQQQQQNLYVGPFGAISGRSSEERPARRRCSRHSTSRLGFGFGGLPQLLGLRVSSFGVRLMVHKDLG